MALRDLVVLLDGSARDKAKLNIAADLAKRHNAHLTGLCPQDLLVPGDVSFAVGGYPDLMALPEFARQMESQGRAKAAIIQAAFDETLRAHGVNGEWQFATGPLIQSVVHRAQVADLVVIGQADPDHPPPQAGRTLVEDVLMAAGRPLLVIPYAGHFETVGTNTLVGWTPTRESARAVHDVLLLLAPGSKVTVLAVETTAPDPDLDTPPTAAIAEHLVRHGLDASATRTVVSDGLSPADALLDYASDITADLLVVGGYGHSRTREMILGGVTRDLLRHMTIPLLISH